MTGLSPEHLELLAASAVTDPVADERGYFTATKKNEMAERGFGVNQQRPPALIIPLFSVTGEPAGFQARPDYPRSNTNGKVVKYETPSGMKMVMDVHPSMRHLLGNPNVPLIVTEGVRKGDAAVSVLGVPAVSLLGVWNFRGTNEDGGRTVLAAWEYVALNGRPLLICFDSDVMLKPEVHGALARLGDVLKLRNADVRYVYLPHGDNGTKIGLDDWLAEGNGGLDALQALSASELRRPESEHRPGKPKRPPAERMTLGQVIDVFTRWMHDPDIEALYAVLAAVVANRSDGDPVWLLIVAPPSAGKTEAIMPLAILDDVHVAGRLTVAALLSGTSMKEQADDATGGLMRQIGDAGIIVNKDFGTVLAMNRDARAEVLQALRDIYDGHYDRPLGTDGGRQIVWNGHCGFIAGCTPEIDNHHAVVSALGDRYIMLRLHLSDADAQARRALDGVGDEEAMRSELGQAVAGLLDHAGTDLPTLTSDERDAMARLASLAVRCRSVVTRDGYSREIINVPPPEQPARIAKQLGKLLAALRSLGCDETTSWRITTRCALDSMPDGRRRVLEELALHAVMLDTGRIGEAIGLPTTTTRRHLEDLEAHNVVDRQRQGEGKADMWSMSPWTRGRWPTVPEMSGTAGGSGECGTVPERSDTHVEPNDEDPSSPLLRDLRCLEDFSGTVPNPSEREVTTW